MHIVDASKPRPSDALVARLGDSKLAQKLVDAAVRRELPQLAAAQAFQERVVARNNLLGKRGADGIGYLAAAIDGPLFMRISQRHATEIAADKQKFWTVTAPRLYPELGIKVKYVAPARIVVMKPAAVTA